jgi:hypothetical protein
MEKILFSKSYCHEYIGEPIFGYEELLQDIYRMRDRKQYKLF